MNIYAPIGRYVQNFLGKDFSISRGNKQIGPKFPDGTYKLGVLL